MKRVAIVVGASSGIGEALVKQLSLKKDIDSIYALARRMEKLQALREACGDKVVPVRCDITKQSALDCLQLEDTLVYAVYSAGVGYHGAAAEIAIEKQAGLIDLNCNAMVRFCVEAANRMERGGKVVVIASAAAFMPQPYFAAYAASKAFTLSFCRSFHKELSARGISVTAVCPGPVDTEFFSISEPTGTVSEKKKKYLISPIVVAQKALRAADKGKSVITPSRSMRMARIAAKLLPHGALIGIYQEDHYEEN